jgi:hypothetical protein
MEGQELRQHIVAVRLRPSEIELVSHAAEEEGISMAAFARRALLREFKRAGEAPR